MDLSNYKLLMNYDPRKTLSENKILLEYGADWWMRDPERVEEWQAYTTENEHEILMWASFGLSFLGPWGRVASVALNIANAKLYYDEGNNIMAGLMMAFCLIPAGQLISKIPAVKKYGTRYAIRVYGKYLEGSKGASSTSREVGARSQYAQQGEYGRLTWGGTKNPGLDPTKATGRIEVGAGTGGRLESAQEILMQNANAEREIIFQMKGASAWLRTTTGNRVVWAIGEVVTKNKNVYTFFKTLDRVVKYGKIPFALGTGLVYVYGIVWTYLKLVVYFDMKNNFENSPEGFKNFLKTTFDKDDITYEGYDEVSKTYKTKGTKDGKILIWVYVQERGSFMSQELTEILKTTPVDAKPQEELKTLLVNHMKGKDTTNLQKKLDGITEIVGDDPEIMESAEETAQTIRATEEPKYLPLPDGEEEGPVALDKMGVSSQERKVFYLLSPDGKKFEVPEGTSYETYTVETTNLQRFPSFNRWSTDDKMKAWVPSQDQLLTMVGLDKGLGPTVSQFRTKEGMYRAQFANTEWVSETANPKPQSWKFECYINFQTQKCYPG